jgi:hypothetical protein
MLYRQASPVSRESELGSGSIRIIVCFWPEKDFSLPLEMTPGGFVIPNEVRDLLRTEPLPKTRGF